MWLDAMTKATKHQVTDDFTTLRDSVTKSWTEIEKLEKLSMACVIIC